MTCYVKRRCSPIQREGSDIVREHFQKLILNYSVNSYMILCHQLRRHFQLM